MLGEHKIMAPVEGLFEAVEIGAAGAEEPDAPDTGLCRGGIAGVNTLMHGAGSAYTVPGSIAPRFTSRSSRSTISRMKKKPSFGFW